MYFVWALVAGPGAVGAAPSCFCCGCDDASARRLLRASLVYLPALLLLLMLGRWFD